jgi:hypothetical protein
MGVFLMKIKDRFILGLISGLAGNVIKTTLDEISLRNKISKRSFRATAAGVWVAKKKQADAPSGQLLGGIFDFGFASLGGVATVYFLSKTGRDYLLLKGATSGLIIGSFITSLLSRLPSNKVTPKDAPSNLSYMLSHVFYGIATTGVATYLGHPSIFDTAPLNNYLEPVEQTTEMRDRQIKQEEQYDGVHYYNLLPH